MHQQDSKAPPITQTNSMIEPGQCIFSRFHNCICEQQNIRGSSGVQNLQHIMVMVLSTPVMTSSFSTFSSCRFLLSLHPSSGFALPHTSPLGSLCLIHHFLTIPSGSAPHPSASSAWGKDEHWKSIRGWVFCSAPWPKRRNKRGKSASANAVLP